MGFESNPNYAAVVTFVSGVSSAGTVAAISQKTLEKNSDPATYKPLAYSFKWGSGAIGAAGGDVTFGFDPKSNWSPTEQKVIGDGLALWSALANIAFTKADNPNEANQLFVRDTNAKTNFQQLTKTIQLSPVDGTSIAEATRSKIVFKTGQTNAILDGSFENYGGWGWQTVLHEEGHALGLSHGGTYVNGKPFSLYQLNAFDTRAWTVMSYLSPTDKANKFYSDNPIETDWGVSSSSYPYRPTTPMMIDIEAVQRL